MVIYEEFSLVKTARCQQNTLFCPQCCRGKETAAGKATSAATATPGLPAALQPHQPRHLPGKAPADHSWVKETGFLLCSPSLHKQQGLLLQRDNRQQDLPAPAVHHFRASLEAADIGQTRRSRLCSPRQTLQLRFGNNHSKKIPPGPP